MNVLITGALGFTARHLIGRLRQGTERTTIMGTDALRASPNHLGLDAYLPADVADLNQMVSLVHQTKPHWIFHLAGLARGSNLDMYRVNFMGAVHLLEAVMAETPEASVLLVGSAAEYGIWPPSEMPLAEDHQCRPVGAYGISKHAMTMAALDYARQQGVKVVVTRPSNLVGAGSPASLVVGAIVHRAKAALADREPAITLGNLESQRDFIAVEDAVDAYVRLIQAGTWGEVFNICSGKAHSIQWVVENLLSFSPRPIQVISEAALRRSHDAPLVLGDASKARNAFGFCPGISLREALRAAWEYVMQPQA